MCAINGITSPDAAGRVNKMNEATKRRGPEGSNVWSNDKITLGHNLLATMGQLGNSVQPMHYMDSSIVFNGAIFNWKDIDEWNCNVDTQVLLRGLHHYGIDFLDRCEGMWAFAWYRDDKLVLCRDRFGIKPLMYRCIDEGLIFSSSSHALENTTNKLDQFAFSMYRSFGYVPGYLTLIQGVHKCVPGEVITYDFNTKKIQKSSIWKKQFTQTVYDKEEFLANLEQAILYSGVTARRRGLFLSGGLDSTSIMHFLNEKSTFTTKYSPSDKKHNDDATKAAMLAEDYDLHHTEMLITDTEFKNNIRQAVKALENPTYNKNNPSYYMINKLMRERGTIITYSGDGGDEMYTGYGTHGRYKEQSCPFLAHFQAIAWKGPKRVQLSMNGKPGGRSTEYCKYMASWFPTQIFGNDFLNNCLAVEMLTRVSDDFLSRNDRFGAHFGMEGRFPLLNNTFYYYIMGIPSSVKMQNLKPNKYEQGAYKFIAREGLKDVLPDYIINKRKTGWSIPVQQWGHTAKTNQQIDSGIQGLIDWSTASPKIKLSINYFKEWSNIYNVTL